jgi:hypothetical protein
LEPQPFVEENGIGAKGVGVGGGIKLTSELQLPNYKKTMQSPDEDE